MRSLVPAAFAVLAACVPALSQDGLRGHGGPVRALAMSPDGKTAFSGSFDQSAIVWSLETGHALAILRAHEGSVNAVAILPDGRFLSAGEDGRVILWAADANSQPLRVTKTHDAAIAGLAVSPDGATYATAAWDGEARIAAIADGHPIRSLTGHRANVNAVAFLPDGGLATASYDSTLRLWPAGGGAPRLVETLTPLNALAALPDRRIAVGGADGSVTFVSPLGAILARVEASDGPIIALAASPDGSSLAAASLRGAVAIIDTAKGTIRFTLNGPGLPVWSLAYSPDGHVLLTGGGDRLVRRWNADTGEHLGAVLAVTPSDDLAGLAGLTGLATRGVEVFRACAVCHALRADGENRAGPTLYGIFGRRAGTLPGYHYSDAFRRLDLVWTPETVSKLFELGPQAYTPGTKMPEQAVTDPQDRAELIDFLKQATQAGSP